MVPDLSLWRRATAVLSILVLTAAASAYLLGAPRSDAYYDFNHRRLQEFRSAHDPRVETALRVVMLGNSRLKNATIDDALLAQLAAERGLDRIETFRLVGDWAVFRNFEPLLDEIEALDPDIYIIQLDLLADEMTVNWRTQIAYHYVRWLARGEGPFTWFEPKGEQLGRVCAEGQFLDMRTSLAELKLKSDTEGYSALLARDFVAKVATGGARVLFVSVPKSAELEEQIPSANPDALAAARTLENRYSSIDIAVFPDALPRDHFCDVSHLGPRGTEVYSRWLIEQMTAGQMAGH